MLASRGRRVCAPPYHRCAAHDARARSDDLTIWIVINPGWRFVQAVV
jgi:hypothetical protein